MSRFAHKTVALGTALALAMSLVGSAFAETPVAVTTQSGSNTAIVVQTGSASSGTAVALPGGTATTGDVHVSAAASVSQATEQTASTVATDGGTANTVQAASNTANIDQTVDAASGDAVADGPNAAATSGGAAASASANMLQAVGQVAYTTAGTALVTAADSTDGVTTPVGGIAQTIQSGTNTDVTLQAVLAQSGPAAAISDGPTAIATSGDAVARAAACHEQVIGQNYYSGSTTAVGGIAVVDQSATQTINTDQAIGAVTGIAEAIVEADTSDLESPESAVVTAYSGDVYASAFSGQFQYIAQEADAYADLLEFGVPPLAAITQVADNTSIANQFALGFSGDAVAILAATSDDTDTISPLILAQSGDVWLVLHAFDYQEISQYCEATAIGPGAIADCLQVGVNDPIFLQGTFDLITANSGGALATGTLFDESIATSGEAGLWFSAWAEQYLDQYSPGIPD